jgi:hypothetical protein
VDPDIALHEFDGDQSENECSDDGFSSHEVGWVVEIVPGELGVFEAEKEFGAQGGSGDGDHRPSDGCRERIAEAVAE